MTFRRLLNELYTNTNISRREKLGNEMIKLLFCKLQDEKTLIDVPNAIPKFRVGIQDHETGFTEVKQRIDNLFDTVKKDLVEEGVFDEHESIILENKSVAYVVGELQEYSLTLTDEDVVGGAFEVFAESKFVGEKGEFFTPREVVKTAIKFIDPQPGESIMDPACGSGGFLICALQHIWEIMETQSPWKDLQGRQRVESKLRIAESTVHGIDKEIDLVKITKAYMAIIGDGKSQIAQSNSLHPLEEFGGHAKELMVENGQFKQFDIILTNPPFGSKETKVSKVESAHYDLGHRWKKLTGEDYEKQDEARATPPQELFIERCLTLLKEGGRMAIVLPETYAHAPSKKYIIHYLKKRCNIKAVIDLPHNTFRPHCNAKTLLWIIEKGTSQGEIIFAVAEQIGRDHRGKIKYRMRNNKITNEIWDDTKFIREEFDDPSDSSNEYTITVDNSVIEKNVYVPRYYWYWDRYKQQIIREAENEGMSLVK